ncbi:MAG: hypothetical protein EZS28_030321 [Streblomastix strix]|uniref:Uncharacterized protein n=1 Tax=Streblomastix strix TaxID=222440 RepID=A0A5J4UWA3_9EUKA|nr:MAG: hypothetical protein EZS28_030321 [Streblomastix strix]
MENATVENIEKFFKAGRGNARVIDGVQNGKVSMNSRRSKQGVVVTQKERAIPTRSPNMEKHYKRWRHLNRRNAMQKKKKQMKKNKRRS